MLHYLRKPFCKKKGSCIDRFLPLKAILIQEPDMEIVGEAIDTVDILLMVGNTHAEIVVADLLRIKKSLGFILR
jgi:hypothetical protein